MKTNSFSFRAVYTYAFFGLFSVFFLSCGGYQNASYFDRDGIYGSENKPANEQPKPTAESTNYKNYFGSLQDNTTHPETFTDVDQYSSISDSISTSPSSTLSSAYTQSNPAWENSATAVNINFYNTNWGMPNYWYNAYWNDPFLYWGWDYWYSPVYIGWGFSPYYSYFGGCYPYQYYYYNPYAPNWYYGTNYYHNGRRYGTGRFTTPYHYGQNYPVHNYNTSPRGHSLDNPRNPIRNNPSYNSTPRNGIRSDQPGTRNYDSPRFNSTNPRSIPNGTREYEQPRNPVNPNSSGSDNNTPRYYNSGSNSPRSQSSPVRVYESNTAPTRNYSAPSNYGNYSNGNSGGGRSGGRR